MFELANTPKTVTKHRKRVGKGEGSNRGKNSGKGHKGQTKHGGKVPLTFEGGRKSLVRRTPKLRGFKAVDHQDKAVLTFDLVSKYFSEKDTVTLEGLREKGLIKPLVKTVRIIKGMNAVSPLVFGADEAIHLTKGVKDLMKK
jgi:large subunit ribosomal protein L15